MRVKPFFCVLLTLFSLCVTSFNASGGSTSSGFSGGSRSSSTTSSTSSSSRSSPAAAPTRSAPPPAAPTPAPAIAKSNSQNSGYGGGSREATPAKAPQGATNQALGDQTKKQAAVAAWNSREQKPTVAKTDTSKQRDVNQREVSRNTQTDSPAPRYTYPSNPSYSSTNPTVPSYSSTYPTVVYPRDRVVIMNGGNGGYYPQGSTATIPSPIQMDSDSMSTSGQTSSVSGQIGGLPVHVSSDGVDEGHPIFWSFVFILLLIGILYVGYTFWYLPRQEIMNREPNYKL